MVVTYCDVTGNEIENGTNNYVWRRRERKYETIIGRDFSVEGRQKIEDAVLAEMGQGPRFDFLEYKRILAEKINEMTD